MLGRRVRWPVAGLAVAISGLLGFGPATAAALPLQEYVNDGAGGHLWNAYDQTADAGGPDITGHPSAIVYGPTVQVFVQSDGGDLMSWVNDDVGGHLWNAYDLSTAANNGSPVASDPDALVDGATVEVFVESDSGALVEYTNNGGAGTLWHAYDMSASAAGGGPVAGRPSAFFVGSTPYVFVRGSNGDLMEYADDGPGSDSWTTVDLSASAAGGGPVEGAPSALDQGGAFDVIVRSATGQLTEYQSGTGAWSTVDLSTAANGGEIAGSDPGAILDGSTLHAYAASDNGDLLEYVEDANGGTGWDAYDLSQVAGAGGQVAGDPSTLVYGPTVHVYVRSAGGDLEEYVNDGFAGRLWNAYDLSQDAGGGGPVGTDPDAVLYGGSVVHVYAGGTNSCQSNLPEQLANTGSATELLTVESPSYASTIATFTAWQLEGGCWQPVLGPITADVGTTGVSDHKTEGDGSTPTGAYPIGSTMYGISPNPGVTYAYHQLVCGDWWDEDPSSADYNTFQHVDCGTTPPFAGDSEALWTEAPAYDYFAVIDYNVDPVVPGAGSAIFLHVDTGGPTAGCVSIPEADLVSVLDWLNPSAQPLIVIGTAAEITGF